MMKHKSIALLILSTCFFLLFLAEILLMNPVGCSFRGVYTEKVFFLLYLLLGFISLHRLFFWGFLTVIILSIIPMCIPFISFFGWLGNNQVYPIDKQIHFEEVHRFGQTMEGLAWIESRSLFFEEKVLEFELGICGFEQASFIDTIQLENKKLQIVFDHEHEKCTCLIDLDAYQVSSSLDRNSYALKLENKQLRLDFSDQKPAILEIK